MKQMNELLVGETANVTVEDTDIGYATIQGTEYFVMGYIDAIELAGELATEETNSLDTYFVSKEGTSTMQSTRPWLCSFSMKTV